MSNQYTILKDDYELAKQLGQAMENHPDIVRDEKLLNGLLLDILKEKHLEINILRILIKEGMLNELIVNQEPDDLVYNRYVLTLQQGYAISEDVARRMAWIWLYSYRAIVQKRQVKFSITPCSPLGTINSNNKQQSSQANGVSSKMLHPHRTKEHLAQKSEKRLNTSNHVGEKATNTTSSNRMKTCSICGMPVKDGDQSCPLGHLLVAKHDSDYHKNESSGGKSSIIYLSSKTNVVSSASEQRNNSSQATKTSDQRSQTSQKRKKRGGWLKLCILAVIIFLLFKTGIIKSLYSAIAKQDSKQSNSVQIIDDPYEVGKTLYFGHYEQDGDLSNGSEAIEWIILDNQGDSVMLISKLALENKYYDEKSTGLSYKSDWENCTLRKWLNDSFYTKAFSNNEQSKIILSSVSCCSKTGNKGYTKDKVFLLSDEEERKYFKKGYSNMCAQSDMAYKTNGGGIQKNTTWWLRITENASKYAPVVCPSPSWTGTMRGGYEDVYMTRHGVRPVVWMKKN